MKPLLIIILDTRRKKGTGKYPVKLRITFNRLQKYYPIGIDVTNEEFLFMMNPNIIDANTNRKGRKRLNEYQLKCNAILVKANETIDKINDFSFKLFERKFLSNRGADTDLFEYYKEIIQRKKQDGQLSTASNYQSSLTSLKKFSPKLELKEVSSVFLKEYEKWLLGANKSISTVGIYLRPLRAIMNEAISEGIISKEIHYPFGKRKYQIPASRNIKKALTTNEIAIIFRYDAIKNSWREKAKDFFIFSYLGNGMNMKDIALLKFKNIDGDYLRFSRAKTLYTNRTSNMQISIYISPELMAIINRWKNVDDNPDNFLFPILELNLTAEREMAILKQFIRGVNKYIRLIAKEVGIDKPITTYYARHSFATVLRRSGASTELISESLGHSSLKTTNSYLDSFEDEKKKEIFSALTNF